MQGHIQFEGNPWPDGHAIKEMEFGLLLGEDGVSLLLHLRSENYYVNDPDDEEEAEDEESESSWTSKGVWGNYHSCILSNLYWGVDPVTPPRLTDLPLPIDPRAVPPMTLHIDPLELGEESPLDDDDHAFHIYLLGHDSVAALDISIRQQDNRLYDVALSGLIALAYVGDYEHRYRFRATASDVAFAGFMVLAPDGVTGDEREARARAIVAHYVTDETPLRFEPAERGSMDWLRPE